MLDLDETGDDAKEILHAVIEFEVQQSSETGGSQKIRLSPQTPSLLAGPRSSASMADSDLPISMPSSEYLEIMNKEREFPEKFYGYRMVQEVSELPKSVRRRYAIPAIPRRIQRIMQEDGKTIAEMRLAGYLELGRWKYKL